MNLSLNDKVALITGASRGIGKAIALGLAQAGADVAIASRKMADLEKVAEEIKSLGRRGLAVPAHVGKIEEIQVLVDKVMDEFGRIDILINNAATNPTMASAIDIDDRAWDSIMNLNLKGLFFLSQAVARIMKNRVAEKSFMWLLSQASRRIFFRSIPSVRPASSWPQRSWHSSGPYTTFGLTPLPRDSPRHGSVKLSGRIRIS